jgi:hypothetical protein
MERRKSRIVRRQSQWSKIGSLPFDLWLACSEAILLVDWDALSETVTVPAGGCFNAALWVCRIWKSRWEPTDNGLFEDNNNGSPSGGGGGVFGVFISSIGLILIALCLANAAYCYMKTKKYTLLGRASSNPPDTPSARKIKYKAGSEEPEDLWSLEMWDPPLFNVYLAAIYSPLHVIIIWYGPLGIFQVVLVIALSGYLFGLSRVYLTLVKDKSIIHSEVLGEYGKKVVNPIIAVPRRDVAVGTDSDTVEIYSPARPTAFTTRDVRESRQNLSFGVSSPWQSSPNPIQRVRQTYTGSPRPWASSRRRTDLLRDDERLQ